VGQAGAEDSAQRDGVPPSALAAITAMNANDDPV
jgi:hypothetical protein